MSRCEQLEFDIDEMKDEMAIQQYELITLESRLSELQLRIEQIINKTDHHRVYGAMFGGGIR